MIKDFSKYVEEKIENKENKKIMLDYISHSIAIGKSESRINKYLDALTPMSNRIGKPFRKMKKRDIERYVKGLMERKDYADWTKYTHMVVIKNCFFAWLYETEPPEYPKVVEWMKFKRPKSNNKVPEDMITEEEAKRMVDAATNLRDKAFVSFLFESGARIGEIMNMRIRDVQFGDDITHAILNGKTGIRKIPIISSVDHLKDWINKHPGRSDPESKVFYNKLSGDFNEKTTYWQVRWILMKIARKAKVAKKVNAHNFRHSQATLMSTRLTERLMKMYFGWGMKSNMADTYVHMNSTHLTDVIRGFHETHQDNGQLIQTIREAVREEIKYALRKMD